MNPSRTPSVRFKGYEDEWEERKLGELLKSAYQGINTAGDKVIYSEKGVEILQSKHITSGYITFDDTRFLDKKRYSEYFPKYVPKKHDILFANIGTIGPSTVVETNKEFLIAWNILKMTPNENVNSKFIELFLQILNEKHYYEKITTGNATKFVNKDAILNIELCISSFKEQQKIGSFFQQLDNTIALHQRKLNLLNEQKKGFLQKMFPKNGEKIPEIRFAGFNDDWEERKFKDILKTHSFRSYLADISENGEYEVIQQGDKPIVGYSDGKPFTNYKDITLFGDHTVSLYKPKRPFFVATDGVKILSADNFEGDYLYTTLERYKPEPQGYKRHFTILKNQDVWFTRNMEEQQNIGTFFKQLDKTIALHQRKIDELKSMKKSMLQKMFV